MDLDETRPVGTPVGRVRTGPKLAPIERKLIIEKV